MLALKPKCGRCERALPPDSQDAMICSFECTFCRTCCEQALKFICPNCGGQLVTRPTRAKHHLAQHPAST